MKKQALILDFDGVVVHTENLWIEYINRKYVIDSKKEDYNNNISLEENVNKLTGLNLSFDELYYDITANLVMSYKLHKNVQLLPDADTVIRGMAKKYSLFISTARNSLGRDVVRYVLDRHNILQHFCGFHFVYSIDDRREFIKYPKKEFISSFDGNVSFFIDDSHREIEKTKKIVPSILLDTQSSRVVEGAWTTHSWSKIGDLVL